MKTTDKLIPNLKFNPPQTIRNKHDILYHRVENLLIDNTSSTIDTTT